jgi:hypothetical protein
LVVLGRVELQLSEEFAVVGEDADVELVDQDEDVGAGVAAADADVVEPAVVAQGEHAAGVELVVADAVLGVVQGQAGRDGLGPGLVGLDRGAPAEGAVGPLGVVVAAEGVELGLELPQGPGPGPGGEPLLEGLVEPFDLAAGLGW